jgi:dihydroflavonol-4-reductase
VKKAFVTGASGFIGSAVVRELLADGVEVRVLMRASADHAAIKGLKVEVITGDVNDPPALARGLVGCDACFHVAGVNALWLRGPVEVKAMYDANEKGAELVLKTAAFAGCGTIVHTSSVVTIARPSEDRPGDERDFHKLEDLSVHYARSKFLGEERARKLANEGAPVVIVNPSAPMGPFDVKPTPTGRVVLDFLLRKMPGYMETGLNVIDVHDCARGHILAAQKGKPGERYILANENLSILEIFQKLAELTGLPAPGFKVPKWVALTAAFASEVKAKVLGKPPKVPLAGVRMALKPMFYSNARAVAELGLKTRPAIEALRRAAAWFVDHGYAQKPPKELGSWLQE